MRNPKVPVVFQEDSDVVEAQEFLAEGRLDLLLITPGSRGAVGQPPLIGYLHHHLQSSADKSLTKGKNGPISSTRTTLRRQMTDVLSFEDALRTAAEVHANRHLLLGNGLSIACRPNCFTYGRLLDEADLSKLSVDGLALFASEGTTDFEEIVNSLRVAGRMATFYESSDPDLTVRLAADADLVKAALADTLARNHPDNVGDIEPEEYEQARHAHVFRAVGSEGKYKALRQPPRRSRLGRQQGDPDPSKRCCRRAADRQAPHRLLLRRRLGFGLG